MKINCAHDEIVPLAKLVPNPKNPNVHPKSQIERLAQIIEFQGQRSPIVVSNRSGFITKGHGRLAAITMLGWDAAAVDYQDYESEAQEWADIVADNAIALWAELDQKLISEETLKLPELNIELLGMEKFKLITPEILDPKNDPDSVPVVSHPITAKGDVWILGRHRLMCGDSTMIDEVEKLMSGNKPDMVLTDPPYNQAAQGGGFLSQGRESRKKLIASESLNNFEPAEFLATLSIMGIQTSYIFCSKNLLKDYIGHFDQSGLNWNLLIMKKKNPIPQKNNTFLADVEYLFCARVKGAYWKNDCPFEYYHRVREINVRPSEFGHPTEKQVAYLEPYLEISCPPSGSVVDFFAGSGTILITCEKNDRTCYAMELDEKYCDVIIKRWQNFTGQAAILESTAKTYEEMVSERKK